MTLRCDSQETTRPEMQQRYLPLLQNKLFKIATAVYQSVIRYFSSLGVFFTTRSPESYLRQITFLGCLAIFTPYSLSSIITVVTRSMIASLIASLVTDIIVEVVKEISLIYTEPTMASSTCTTIPRT